MGTSLNRRDLIQLTAALCIDGYTSSARADTKPKVAVFSGHTTVLGKQGAVSCTGTPEYKYNDAILDSIEKNTSNSIEYILMKAHQNIPLTKRPQLAAELNADLCIEIHHDSIEQADLDSMKTVPAKDPSWKKYSGFSLFYSTANPQGSQSLRLAQLLGDNLNNFLAIDSYHRLRHRMVQTDPKRGIYRRNWFITRKAQVPTVLLECGYIINPEEEKFLSKTETRKKIANAIDTAARNYFKLS